MMSFRPVALSALAGVLALAGCADRAATGPAAQAPDTLRALPRTLTATERQAIDASNGFAFRLFGEALTRAPRGANVVLSPFSASVALGMTLNGAAGSTAAGMRTALGWDASTADADINAAYRGLATLLPGLDRTVTVTSANAIWYRQGFPFEASFLETARSAYDAQVTGADFAAPATLTAINAWARERTNGRIPQVLEQIEADQVMFLLNALYFKGAWRQRFDVARTAPGPFTTGTGTVVQVPFMARTGKGAGYVAGPTFSALELPYGNGAFVMDFFLPAPGRSLAAVAEQLRGPGLAGALAGLREVERLEVAIPRFRVSTSAQLKEPLTALGMGQAFVRGGADFTRMSASRGRDLFLDFVKQDVLVEVNEEGTEAAAVTTVGVGVVSLPPEFRLDRPFLFVIRERFSNTVLFVGAVQQP